MTGEKSYDILITVLEKTKRNKETNAERRVKPMQSVTNYEKKSKEAIQKTPHRDIDDMIFEYEYKVHSTK